jgi:hypothetical protein
MDSDPLGHFTDRGQCYRLLDYGYEDQRCQARVAGQVWLERQQEPMARGRLQRAPRDLQKIPGARRRAVAGWIHRATTA